MREDDRKTLFPPEVANPAIRLLRALVLAALTLTLLFMLFNTLMALISGRDAGEAYASSADAFERAGTIAFLFVGTLGLAGVGMLWVLAIRNMVVWAFLGGTLGAVGGAFAGAGNPTEFGAATLGGWAMFLLIRWFAGIRD